MGHSNARATSGVPRAGAPGVGSLGELRTRWESKVGPEFKQDRDTCMEYRHVPMVVRVCVETQAPAPTDSA